MVTFSVMKFAQMLHQINTGTPSSRGRHPIFRLALLLSIATLMSCASLDHRDDWPRDLPSLSYFRNAYENDGRNRELQDEVDYLSWVVRFFHGFNLTPGWQEMTDQVLLQVHPIDRRAVAERLVGLGRSISAEWAKDNGVRRINTRHVNVWKDALQESLAQASTKDYLGQLESDVSALLSGKLAGDEIYFERYYYDPFDD